RFLHPVRQLTASASWLFKSRECEPSQIEKLSRRYRRRASCLPQHSVSGRKANEYRQIGLTFQGVDEAHRALEFLHVRQFTSRLRRADEHEIHTLAPGCGNYRGYRQGSPWGGEFG